MSKILPCPFCGCENDPVRKNTRVYYGTLGRREEHDYYLNCDGCNLIIGTDKERDTFGDFVCVYSTPEEALKFWNSRRDRLKINF